LALRVLGQKAPDKVILARVSLLAGLLLCASALAQSAAPSGTLPAPAGQQDPRFEIRRFIVDGASLLTAQEISAATLPYTGSDRDFSDVQRALEALEKAYSSKGYSAVQVILPEQELERGEVRFKVTEAKIGKLVVEGNKFFDEQNVRASLPSLAPGAAPNIQRIADNLRVANENPAKQSTVLLRGGTEEGQVDAVVRITEERPEKYSVSLDNTGTNQTGLFRIGFGYQHANVFNRDHVLSAQYVTAPHDPDAPNTIALPPNKKVTIFGLAYRVPLYEQGNSLDISAGYSNVNSGIVNLSGVGFNVSGSGTIFGLRYNVNLPKWGELEQRVALGYDWRAYSSQVSIAGSNAGSLVPDVTVHPVSATYVGVYRTAQSESAFNVGVFHNLPGGNDGNQPAFEASRANSNARYVVYRFGLNHNQAFASDWQMRLGFSGQVSRMKLISGEQFGVGGVESVRGFLEREITNDNGVRGTLEFYTPDLAGKAAWLAGSRTRGVVFYDWGWVGRNEPLPFETARQSIASVGFGMRYARGLNMAFRLDYAVVVDPGGLQGQGEGRMHASFTYVF
jgi:hemolysin activation/secretion protein